MSEIRVTYSGLIGLGIGLITIITGMIFILIITRSLTPEELGTWSLIGSLVTYVVIIEPMISYWTKREIARGIESGKTAILSSGVFSIVGFLAYLVIAYFVSEPTGADVNILFFAALMIPFIFLNRTISAIAIGWKPHLNSIGVLIFDASKLPAAIFFVYYLEQGINGAILSLIFAYIVSNIALAILLRNKIQHKINYNYLKNWLKRAWLPLYIKFPNMVVLDVLIFSVITGSVTGLAYWIVAFTLGTMVRHAGQITRAVYPKLLSGGRKEYLQENLIRLFYFAFPCMAISISFAKPGLYALNPIYDIVALVVVFITLRSFLKILASALSLALQGIEKVDIKESTQKDYLKSKLFYLPTIRLIHRGVYLSTLAIGLLILIHFNSSQIDLLLYWSIIALIVQIPFTLYFYYLVRKSFPLSIDISATIKYLVTSIVVFGGIYFLMERFLEYTPTLIEFLPQLIPYMILGILAYLGITSLIDYRTRTLFNAIILEIKRK